MARCIATTKQGKQCKVVGKKIKQHCKVHTPKDPVAMRIIYESRERVVFTKQQRNLLIKTYGNHCYLCGYEIDLTSFWHVDHVIPFHDGGNDSPANLRPTHVECNEAKGADIGNHIAFLRKYNIPVYLYKAMMVGGENIKLGNLNEYTQKRTIKKNKKMNPVTVQKLQMAKKEVSKKYKKTLADYSYEAHTTEKRVLTRDEARALLESLRSEKGGYSRAVIQALGVSWPPQKGWKSKLEFNPELIPADMIPR